MTRLWSLSTLHYSLEECNVQPFEEKGGFILEFLGVVYLCFLLGRLCDDYFIYSLEVMSQKMKLTSDVSGATLLAFGGSFAELIIATVGTFQKKNIGMATIMGSAVFNVSGAFGITCFLLKKEQKVYFAPVMRDVIFYLVVVTVLLIISQNKLITFKEAILMTSLYFLYVIGMIVTMKFFSNKKDIPKVLIRKKTPRVGDPKSKYGIKNTEDPDYIEETKGFLPERRIKHNNQSEGTVTESEQETDREEEEEEESKFEEILNVILSPFLLLFKYTIPDARKLRFKKYYSLEFFICTIYVGLISYTLVFLTERIGCVAHINDARLGLIILAIGTSLADLIATVVTARRGHMSMAVGGLIGSNVFDVTIGLGLPWMLFNYLHGIIPFDNPLIKKSSIALFAAILCFFINMIAFGFETRFKTGIVPFVFYVAFVTVFAI